MSEVNTCYRLGVDIGSTTVKIAILDDKNTMVFADYERHYANIQETLALLLNVPWINSEKLHYTQ